MLIVVGSDLVRVILRQPAPIFRLDFPLIFFALSLYFLFHRSLQVIPSSIFVTLSFNTKPFLQAKMVEITHGQRSGMDFLA